MLAQRTGEQRCGMSVERELLTPYGLRSLAPRDPQYRGRYEGDPCSRDSAYHQGTVWPWLMGPFITAYLKVQRTICRSPASRHGEWLAAFRRYIEDEGVGQIPEVFDGDRAAARRRLHRASLERGGVIAVRRGGYWSS